MTSPGPSRLLQRRSTTEVERGLQDEDELMSLHPHSTHDRPQEPSPRIKLTPWRCFNTFFILSIGIPKALYAYQGFSTTPNTLDWILGVLWALTSYWFTVMEMERPDIWPWFFQHEVELPLRVVMVVISIFGFFFMFSLCFVTFVALIQWIARSKYGGLIIFLGFIIVPSVVIYCILHIERIEQRLSTSRLLHALARSWHAFPNLFSSQDWDMDIGETVIFLWLIPFVVFLITFFVLALPENSDEPKSDLLTFRIAILTSTIFGVSGVLATVVTFGTVGIFRMGMRLISLALSRT